MDEHMTEREQTILLVSEDAALCAAARREFEETIAGLRVTTVGNMEGARRILEEDAPAVILLEESTVVAKTDQRCGAALPLDALVTSLAVYAPVVVIGAAGRRKELTTLIAAGAADYVARDNGCLPVALGLIQRRLRQAQNLIDGTPLPFGDGKEDFGEVLRHELNNPLTGILGNAELLLAEIHKKDDGKLPHGGRQRVETIAALAVRLRETVRRLSQEWEAWRTPVQ
jgi:signal transduction histidine kinase